jgi:hypothetical protein
LGKKKKYMTGLDSDEKSMKREKERKEKKRSQASPKEKQSSDLGDRILWVASA